MTPVSLARLVCAALVIASGSSQARPPVLTASVLPPGQRLSAPPWAATWDAEKVSWPVPPLVRHADVEAKLRDVWQAAPDLFQLEEIGRSVEGRSINHLWFGRGLTHVLLWSQMHGDEPTATAALFDMFEHVRRHRDTPAVRGMLDALTIHVVPMLNPDGAERFQRRNAQGIDINRDALRLQTPEGRALKALRDRLNPAIGFNLHNQGWRTSAGHTKEPASISLLSASFDEARTETPGRVLAKQLCVVIREALEPLAPGRVARYDDEFEVRAFGDNMTRWGTSVVLIETGPWPATEPDPHLVRLNFVALMAALDALATGHVKQANTMTYDALPVNGSSLFYLLLRNAAVVSGTGIAPFTADIGIVANRGVGGEGEARSTRLVARIEDLGDLHPFGALEDVNAAGMVVAPLWDPAIKVGDRLSLPDWSATKSQKTVAPGQPAELLLLRQEGTTNAYRVVRVIRY